MPATSTTTQICTISAIRVNINAPSLDVDFDRVVGGADIGAVTMHLAGDPFLAIFGTPGDGVTPRGIDLNNALYAAAVQLGVISGTVTSDVKE